MEKKASQYSSENGLPEELPPLNNCVQMASKSLDGFNIECGSTINGQTPSTNNPSPQEDPVTVKTSGSGLSSFVQSNEYCQSHSISISMPSSPSGFLIEQTTRVIYCDGASTDRKNKQVNHPADLSYANSLQSEDGKYQSQPILEETSYGTEAMDEKVFDSSQLRVSRANKLKDKRYDSFKTWSGKLERQLSNLRGKPQEFDVEANDLNITDPDAVPSVHRYFDALEGPELDTLSVSEVLALPEDEKWPFLLRFPVSCFGMCLGVSSQAILWKTLATTSSMEFLPVSLTVNFILWCISLALMIIVSAFYSLKIIFYFEAVRREYYHPIRVNFFFAPWIACLFLAIGVPPSITENLHSPLWYVLMTPILCLELKVYGRWMSGGQCRLSKVANPSNHLSIMGNFAGALLGASMGLKEGPIFFFAVGLAHYTVLFVTLYQRLPSNETLPKELHPVFFLFVAAPSVACVAWANICGNFDHGSRIAYFIALFLYVSLAVRINFFRGFRFSLAWWAYTCPMTGASIATVRYSNEVKYVLIRILAAALSSISTFAVTALFVSTTIHAFVLHDLFPNDISIAITKKRSKCSKKRSHPKAIRSGRTNLEASATGSPCP